MYCIQCGVKLADTEKRCPLCGTEVYHPVLKQSDAPPLYPKGRSPKRQANPQAFNGIIIFLFLIPLLICLLCDLKRDGELNWFDIAAGGILLTYIVIALPQWFQKPNPIIFIPCDCFASILYLWYINLSTGGAWFWSFALPIAGILSLIVCAWVTLSHYLHRGRFFIFGGGFIALGIWILLIELFLDLTFRVAFVGWSMYPLIVLVLLGGGLLYLGISASARETMARKFFF